MKKHLQYAVQITASSDEDGTWIVSQLYREKPDDPYKRKQKVPKWIVYSEPMAAHKLLEAIAKGLKGKL